MSSRFRNLRLIPAILAVPCLFPSSAPASVPDGRWNLQVSEGECRLERTFTTPGQVRFSLETDVGTDSYSLSIMADKFKRAQLRVPQEAVLKVDGRTAASTYVVVFPSENSAPPSANLAGLSNEVVDAIGAGRELSIAGDLGKFGPLPLPQAKEAITAFRRCEAEQLTEWGADPAQFTPGGRRPRVDQRRDLIPQAELRRFPFPKGPVQLAHYLVIDADGVVERCSSVSGLENSDFERAVCNAVKGRKIGEPARDATGKAVRGVVTFYPALVRTMIVRTQVL